MWGKEQEQSEKSLTKICLPTVAAVRVIRKAVCSAPSAERLSRGRASRNLLIRDMASHLHRIRTWRTRGVRWLNRFRLIHMDKLKQFPLRRTQLSSVMSTFAGVGHGLLASSACSLASSAVPSTRGSASCKSNVILHFLALLLAHASRGLAPHARLNHCE